MTSKAKKMSRPKGKPRGSARKNKSSAIEKTLPTKNGEWKAAPQEEQDAYRKAFSELMAKSDEIVEWKISRTLEEAKILSVNADFQKTIAEIRQRYGIKPRIQSNLVQPGAVLREYTAHLNEEGHGELEDELNDLARKFDLAWFDEGEDYGLIVGALCYGLTPEILTLHWDEVRYSMAGTRTPGVKLTLDWHDRLKGKLADQIVISYLFLLLKQRYGIDVEMPGPIREVIQDAFANVGGAG